MAECASPACTNHQLRQPHCPCHGWLRHPLLPKQGEDRPSQPTIQQSASQRPAPAGLSHGCLRHPPASLASLGHPNAPSTRSARLRPLPASAPSGTSTLTSNLGLGLGQCFVHGIEMAGLARLSDQLTVLYSERSASTPVKPVLFSELSCIMARRGSPTDLRIRCRYDWAAMVIMAQQSMRSSWHVLLPTTYVFSWSSIAQSVRASR